MITADKILSEIVKVIKFGKPQPIADSNGRVNITITTSDGSLRYIYDLTYGFTGEKLFIGDASHPQNNIEEDK